MHGFIQRHGQKRAWVDTQQTVTDEARQRVFLGQAWVFDQRTVSNRARQREIIQAGENTIRNRQGKTMKTKTGSIK